MASEAPTPAASIGLAADYPVLRLIRLTQNYRSTPEILRLRPAGDSGATEKERRLEPQSAKRQGGGAAARRRIAFAEALFIAKEINRMVGGIDMLDAQANGPQIARTGVRGFADIAVLYRTHRQADLLEYCFAKEGIPYTVAGRDDFLEAPQVRRVAAFFRFLLDPADVLSLRVCLLAADSHARKRLEELTAAFAAGGNSLSALADMLDGLEERDLDGGFPLLAQALRKFPPLVRRGKPAELLEAWMRDNALEEDRELGRLRDVAVFHERMPGISGGPLPGQRGGYRAPVAGIYTGCRHPVHTPRRQGPGIPCGVSLRRPGGKDTADRRAWDRPGGGTAAVLCGPHPGKGGAAAVRLRRAFPLPAGYPAELSGEGG